VIDDWTSGGVRAKAGQFKRSERIHSIRGGYLERDAAARLKYPLRQLSDSNELYQRATESIW
jgi:hypothetical protein